MNVSPSKLSTYLSCGLKTLFQVSNLGTAKYNLKEALAGRPVPRSSELMGKIIDKASGEDAIGVKEKHLTAAIEQYTLLFNELRNSQNTNGRIAVKNIAVPILSAQELSRDFHAEYLEALKQAIKERTGVEPELKGICNDFFWLEDSVTDAWVNKCGGGESGREKAAEEFDSLSSQLTKRFAKEEEIFDTKTKPAYEKAEAKKVSAKGYLTFQELAESAQKHAEKTRGLLNDYVQDARENAEQDRGIEVISAIGGLAFADFSGLVCTMGSGADIVDSIASYQAVQRDLATVDRLTHTSFDPMTNGLRSRIVLVDDNFGYKNDPKKDFFGAPIRERREFRRDETFNDDHLRPLDHTPLYSKQELVQARMQQTATKLEALSVIRSLAEQALNP